MPMTPQKYLKEKEFFIFELDNVIYPEKDYLLQVYYLFAQFIEYGEQISATEVLNFMQETFLKDGANSIFEKTSKQFNIPEKYHVNFEMLQHSVRLPLKLLVYNEVSAFLQAIVLEGKQIFLFVQGSPAMQLNKIKQTEWNGLERHLKVFFEAEFETEKNPLKLIMEQHQLDNSKAVLIGCSSFAENAATVNKVDYLNVNELFNV